MVPKGAAGAARLMFEAGGPARVGDRIDDVAPEKFNTESYARIDDNPFLEVVRNPLSTFSIDVDTASYANVRRFLTQGTPPPPDAVRIEELLNYFTYRYPPPRDDEPFAVHTEVAECPWNGEHRLVRIGIKGKEIELGDRPASNLVFLVDVSGSMQVPNKLPLLKQALVMLVRQLTENDRVAIVVYAGAAGLVLPSTTGDQSQQIASAIERLQAGGSTNGGQGIELAYAVAEQHKIVGGTNRVILATDGDFNVGVSDQGSLTRLIENKAEGGVFLSVLGFGSGNYKDDHLEKLADRGNGNYAYIDAANEARKVLVEQMAGTLVTIAKDVKVQIEFNPVQASAYRLIGYENRLLRSEDFNDDRKDAGEIGAGHTVTALYEVVPADGEAPKAIASTVEPLKYQDATKPSDAAAGGELLTLRLRYKPPEGDTSFKFEFVVRDEGRRSSEASADFKFAAAVAAYGMLLRQSPHCGNATWDAVAALAEEGLADDPGGYRAEFVELVRKAKALSILAAVDDPFRSR
jgi:Ca-activated chloride channel family protein